MIFSANGICRVVEIVAVMLPAVLSGFSDISVTDRNPVPVAGSRWPSAPLSCLFSEIHCVYAPIHTTHGTSLTAFAVVRVAATIFPPAADGIL